jgi:predicted lipoprotein with Yx(FWY)xxD motif
MSGCGIAMMISDGMAMARENSTSSRILNKDRNPGDVTGDGVNNVWHIAAP